MPKVGMERKRRRALVRAAIDEIGEQRSLNVTVARIARRAGMSSGLAHHYFGNKDQMLVAAMRHILAEFSRQVRTELASATGARARLEAIIRANFGAPVFDRRRTSAWLSFYGLAQSDRDAAHLIRIYQRRLHSNLMHELRHLTETPEATAQAIAAMIDGVYLRAALSGTAQQPEAANRVLTVVNALIGDAT